MAVIILEDCISCDACLNECPNEAISNTADTNLDIYLINHNRCSECVGSFETSQCIDVCPVDCIEIDPNHIETKNELMDKFLSLKELI